MTLDWDSSSMEEDQDDSKIQRGESGGGERRDDHVASFEENAVRDKAAGKMKLNRMSSGELSGEDIVREPRICVVCNREFSSGKALGGHMRVHIQANKKEDNLVKTAAKLKKQSTKISGPGANNADDTTCSLCGKDFPSRKSLFGHMRCHPEREWRGIQPPPTAKNSSSSTLSELLPRRVDDQFDSATTGDKCVTDLLDSLSGFGWATTDRRGRKKLLLEPEPETEPDDDDIDGALNLLSLGNGDFCNPEESSHSYRQREVEEEFEGTNSNSPPNKAGIEEKNQVCECTAASKKRRIEVALFGPLRIEEGGNSGAKPLKKMDGGGKSKGKALLETGGAWEDWPREDMAVEEESDSKNTHGSPLGDQLNSLQEISMKMMKKKKRRKIKLIDLEVTTGGGGGGGGGGDSAPLHQTQKQNPIAPDRYRCTTCNKSFSTHQALGGHRSSHNKFKNSQTMDDSACAEVHPDHEHYGFISNASPSPNPISHVHEAQVCNDAAAAAPTAAPSPSILTTIHQCKCCNKTFPTGQALGGHMRCHWSGPSEAPSSQVTSPGEASQTGPKLVLGFDLNELPPMEDDEGTESVTHAAGDAFSSHNSVN